MKYNTQMINNQNVPKLRFKEFSGEWEEKKTGELCDSIVPGRNKPTSFDGEIPWITTPDIEHNGIINFSKNRLNISKDEAKNVGSKIVPKNSIIISCVGELGLVAIAGKEIVINQQLHAFIPKDQTYYRFLLYQVGRQKKYMDRVSTKTAVPYMNKENCNSIPISFPSLPEQQKIATFLTAIDTKIDQLKKKQTLLTQYKKGVMQKLFSQELRFKADDGSKFSEWEEKKLGKIARITTGSSNRQDSNLDGEFIFFDRSQDIRTSDRFLFDAETIIVPGEGQEFIPKYFKGKFDLHQRTYAIMDFKDINGIFLFYSISFNSKHLNSHAVGSTVKSLRLPMFETMPINLPSLFEQTKIANFLTALDTKITLRQAQGERLKQFKKGLLQQMFV